MKAVEKRVREIANAVEWSGDMRVNMTTVIGALRSAVKLLDEEKNKTELASSVISSLVNSINSLPMCIEDFIGEDAYDNLNSWRKLK